MKESISQKYKNSFFTWLDSDMYGGTEVGILIPAILENEHMPCDLLFPEDFLGLSLCIDVHFCSHIRRWNWPAHDFTLSRI